MSKSCCACTTKAGVPSCPAAFIPAAERYGLMTALDRWVVRNVFPGHPSMPGRRARGAVVDLRNQPVGVEHLAMTSFLEYLQRLFRRIRHFRHG
ncbi:EAL domain-containing protein [Pseudomonas putida]|nr:EAL domain-containing protein [Pseudomonas putida]